MLAVKTFDLTKKYGKVTGIENVNIDIEAGEIFGLVGPDGAGKTTFVRLLMNYIFPTSGSAVIFGNDVITEAKENKMIVGYVPAEVECYGNMKAGKYIKTSMKFHKTKKRSEEYARLIELFGVRKGESFDVMDRSDKKVLAIVAALVNEPQLIILDEPARGLDSSMKNRLFEYLLEKNKEGMTIILTAEREDDLQGICTHVAHIDGTIAGEEQQEVAFIPEETPNEVSEEEGWQDKTIAFVSSAEQAPDESSATALPEEDDIDSNDSIFDNIPPTVEETTEVLSLQEDAPTESIPLQEELKAQETEPQAVEGNDKEKEVSAHTIEIPTIPSGAKGENAPDVNTMGAPDKQRDHITTTSQNDAKKSIKLKTAKFDPAVFEQLGAKIIKSENGKVSIAYSGDLERLAEAIRSMEFNDLSIGEDLSDDFQPLLNQEKKNNIGDAPEGSVEE
ncbi:MAG: ATP-binding cassette domain-containing protein [Bacillota bacterium]|nr:ATP-binding cassette domain-containing protein [Bacillota bacterium]